ncbi:BLUF domain-containing protein [Caenibius sp. WL]|uniref:BLUF domain-containing protein n=1 Tax=Caenibius sp. WL TaxID=2872646 RepID=UPI001C99CF5A|nr:BLUF domain-containing protein [Caenibius sp. WL]QZP08646.1 BLUF domain-containing protein [Caenibius sp. WL]
MRQFVYISTAADLGDGDIAAILAASQRNNALRDITGFLLYNGRNFLQLIEGPAASLLALMRDLHADRRHSGIVRLEDIPIAERDCADWIMRRIYLADEVAVRQDKLDSELPMQLSAQTRRTVLNFAILN